VGRSIGSKSQRRVVPNGEEAGRNQGSGRASELRQNATHPDRGRRKSERCGWLFDCERQTLRHGLRTHGTPWSAESPVLRVDDEPTHRVDRLRAIGNGVVPQVVAAAFRGLADTLGLGV
jgi:site-specific DNA-cytosine methylase